MSPLVTIAIPILNAMPYLRDSIQSVVNQTYKDWVMYLINDGSTDDSLSVMQEFAANDVRIKILDDGQNKGLIARLNQSTSLCRTKYFARMDADDIMYITRIEEQVRFMESHPEVDVCGTGIMRIDNENNIVGSRIRIGNVTIFEHPTVMGKTSWFKSNPYAEWAHRAEDFELWTRTRKSSKFIYIEKPLFFYREFGVPTLKKYYLSQKTIIQVALHYQKYDLSLLWCLRTAMLALLKICVNALFAVIGKMDVLILMRGNKNAPAEIALTNEDLLFSIKNKRVNN